MTRPPRPRRKQRELERKEERAVRKAVKRTESLAAQLPGGAPERPIEVSSASVIENKARSVPCPQCRGTLELRADRATSTARGVLRELALVCRQCHAPRTLWFRIAATQAN